MILEMLHIEIEPSYSDNAGKYKGRIKFANKGGDITMQLNASLCNAMLAIVADELVSTSRELATKLTTACIDSTSNIKSLS
jgi:hypothetical protein